MVAAAAVTVELAEEEAAMVVENKFSGIEEFRTTPFSLFSIYIGISIVSSVMDFN